MITNKYNYVALSRETVDGQRKYATPDGHKLASVTTILDATKPEEEKKALQEWRRRMGPQKAQEITTEAASRGTRMHKWLEDFCKTGEIAPPGSNPYSKQSHGMAQTVIDQGLCNVSEIWGVEVPLYYPVVYAGTTDGCGLHLNDEAIIDYKQSNKEKKREWIDGYFLQLCAYAIAHNSVHGTNIRKGVIMMCVKPKDEVSLPVYQEFILEGTEFDKYANLWWERVETYYTMQL